MTPNDVLQYWFGEIHDTGAYIEQQSKTWFSGGRARDGEIKSRFGQLYEELVTHQHDDWLATPEGGLAAIIAVDQFSRHIHRGSAAAFTHDAIARHWAAKMIAESKDIRLHPIQRPFIYLPFEHSESKNDQIFSVSCFQKLAKEVPPVFRESIQENLVYAVKHWEIIERFGRFPHRNEILGRKSTDEEKEFLKTPGSSF